MKYPRGIDISLSQMEEYTTGPMTALRRCAPGSAASKVSRYWGAYDLYLSRDVYSGACDWWIFRADGE
jgi:hypothetical protein